MKAANRIAHLGLASMLFFSFSASLAFAKKAPDFTKYCKKECPGITDVNAAHECVEKLEHGDDAAKFKKTKCYKMHERWEEATGKEAEEHEKKEKSEGKGEMKPEAGEKAQ